ncbi:MAG: aldo/keto reductase, partial [Candidatus Atribacteria bacterium]|nr:aldo/keto reductase [Candidatus Atribacteria bacterium]
METNKKIQMRHLGKTDILVTPIGLGVMELAGGGGLIGRMFPVIPQDEKNAIIKAALEGGINWFDTAEMYGAGVSEQSLATGLKAAGKSDRDVVIATKWQPFLRTAGNIPRTIENRLHFLGGYSIGNYMIHQPYSFSSPEVEMNAMADLVEAGKIRSVGVSNFNPARMRRAHAALAKRGIPLAVNQVRYSLLNREIETNGVLITAKELGVTIIAYTPVARGLLTGKYHQDPGLLDRMSGWRKASMQRNLERSRPLINTMDEIATKYEATIAQVALNWLINFNGEIVVTIPGATKVRQAEESAGAMKFRLSDDEMARLDE